jgi:hypothetical protein
VGRGHNCYHCDRPLTRKGYMCREVRAAVNAVFERRGVDWWEEVYEECERRLPLRPVRIGIPVGRLPDAGHPVDVVNDVCAHSCGHAAIKARMRANMSQQLALNVEQAIKAGIDITTLNVADPRGWHERHGGLGTYASADAADRPRRRLVQVDTQVFRRVCPAFVEEKLASSRQRSRFEEFLIKRGEESTLAGNRPIPPAAETAAEAAANADAVAAKSDTDAVATDLAAKMVENMQLGDDDDDDDDDAGGAAKGTAPPRRKRPHTETAAKKKKKKNNKAANPKSNGEKKKKSMKFGKAFFQ